ncbi:hypothetical protein F5X97DRAFT_9056 [Nemania serpens]|nr:hypothetical protein F5X97DRAFT_9056 [Nemania serpens]
MSSSTNNDPSWPVENDSPSSTHNRSWPGILPEAQRRFEQTFLRDGETLNFDVLPKLAPVFGGSDAARARWVMHEVAAHSTYVQRPLTSAEANAVTEHSAAAYRYAAWTLPVTIGIATATAFSGRRTFKFPFYQPKMKKFDPFSFPTRRIRLAKGFSAVAMWHSVRMVTYASLLLIPTSMVLISISITSFKQHAIRDPRLSRLIEEASRREQIKFNERQMRRRTGAPNTPGTVPQNPQQVDDGAYQDRPTPQVYGRTDYDSQQSTAFERPSTAAETSGTTEPYPPRTQDNAPPSFDSRQDDDFDPLADDEDDDASPVAASVRRPRAVTRPSSSSGSSWERLRQQTRSGSTDWEKGDSSSQEQGWAQLRQDKTRNPKDHTPKTDSFSYSGRDEERERRKYEKEQAQKEFDALVAADSRSGGGSK